jgi:hypothetical protein
VTSESHLVGDADAALREHGFSDDDAGPRRHRAVRPLEPDRQRQLDAPERQVPSDGPRSAARAWAAAPMRYLVIIPVLNELRYTTQCIESLPRTARRPAILVIDNGSSDGTPAWRRICHRSVRRRQPRLRRR